MNTNDITIIYILEYFNKKKKLYTTAFFIGILSVLVFTFITPERYESETVLIPQSANSTNSALNYNAASFGIDLNSIGGSSSSPILTLRSYPVIIHSHSFLDTILYQKFNSKKYGESQLIDIIYNYAKISDVDSLKAKNLVHKLLIEKLITVKINNLDSSIIMKVSFYEKDLAKDISEALIISLKSFQNNLLKEKAKDKSEYLVQTIEIKKNNLLETEKVLQEFLEKNKNISSPSLLFQKDRLVRDVEVAKTVYILLVNQFEISKLDEIENLNRVFVISNPSTSHKKHYPSTLFNTLLFTTFFIILSFSVAIFNFRFKK
jgi:uncharacterized protein involved in exopolysaccharide biosynthesis